MKACDDLLSQAFLATRKTESVLRNVVRADLARTEGPLWLSLLPEELVNHWEQIREQEVETGGPVRGYDLLEYATIDEIAGLMRKFSAAFQARFDRIDSIQDQVNEFRLLRNALMHGSDLTESDCLRLLRLTTDLIERFSSAARPASPMKPNEKVPAPPARPTTPLTDEQKTLLEVVSRATERMSGSLTGERDALKQFLRANLERCSLEALANVQKKFARIPGTQALVDDLLAELPPQRPTSPENDWSPSKWLNWASRSYVPYRRWLITHDVGDPEVDAMSISYADWLYHKYPELLVSGQDSLVISTYKWVKQLLDNRVRVLWVVLDNLSVLWLPPLVRALKDAEIQIKDTRRLFSMLPSLTSISRRAMLAGRIPSEAIKFDDDLLAIQHLWMEQGQVEASFCTTLQDVEEALSKGSKLIVLVDNWLDHLAHTPDMPGFDRWEELTGSLAKRASKLGALLRKMRTLGPANLLVSTDHGAIWPGVNSEVIVPPGLVAGDEETDTHRRAYAVQDASGLNPVDWYFLEGNSFGLAKSYAVPRGQRFVGAKPRAFTHGGLSPEETVVTLLIGAVGEREPLSLSFSQSTPPLRLGRPGSLAILVRNPFDVPVEDLVLSVPDLHARFEPIDVPARSEVATDPVQVTVPLRLEVHEDIAYVSFACRYLFSGTMASVSDRLRLNVRVFYESSLNSLEDILNV